MVQKSLFKNNQLNKFLTKVRIS